MYYLYISDAGAATPESSEVTYAQIHPKTLDKKKKSNSQLSHKFIQNVAVYLLIEFDKNLQILTSSSSEMPADPKENAVYSEIKAWKTTGETHSIGWQSVKSKCVILEF